MSDLQTRLHQYDGKLIVENIQDCTAILDDVKARHNQGFHGSKEFRHMARIPNIAVQIYINNNGISFAEFMSNPVHMKLMLNNPELKALRIAPGRV